MNTAMRSRSSQKTTSTSKNTGKSASQKRTTLKLEPSTANTRRINPLTAFINIPLSQEELSSTQSSSKRKGKEREIMKDPSPTQEMEIQDSGQLWVDMYEPRSEAELAVHVRKVENVRNWLRESLDGGPFGKLRKYRRVLVLTGPAGTAKSSTIRVLSQELKFEIIEWKSSTSETFANATDFDATSSGLWVSDDTMFTKFRLFLERASQCQSVFSSSSTPNPWKRPLSSSSLSSSDSKPTPIQRIILLEDLPNVLHSNTRSQFHDVIRSLVENQDPNPVPVVIVLSDSGMRGEAGDERLAGGLWEREQDSAVDLRSILPKDVLNGPYVDEIRFNPIAPTLLKKALQALLSRNFSSQKSPITGQMLDMIVDSANGDIRSAIMALQFACIRLNKKTKGADPQVLMESITRREQSLALFHLMGKVFYNKRKGDPPAPSASARDIKKDQEIDKRLKDPPKLPPYLSEHDRKASRVDVNTIYSDSPIDSSLFSLYIHQNFIQFCTDVDQCDGIADWLSWADSSGGDAASFCSPSFIIPIILMYVLFSAPVPRLNQKVCKPDFFDNINEEKESWDGVRDVRSWIINQGTDSGWNFSGWNSRTIATELGGVLRARDATSSPETPFTQRAPPSHRKFSNLKFVYPKSDRKLIGGQPLHETEVGEPYSDGAISVEEQQEMGMWQDEKEPERVVSIADAGGWLDSDDIAYF
ncbi:Rad17 cell cycle checkpoint protein-domain-containing protein [Lentinula aff. lateritia]|uniref:Rad17 cell cycle checkpoint protein-domain-containing protein n=1 Tax=Lentinula aff. lateritia TaxID=2804960 RepID=A0ACC1TSF9_9AGAR|nr:Rad17 cell cycle checkpoint protein-domain-containing protein [Lentinula aff. lateritia]